MRQTDVVVIGRWSGRTLCGDSPLRQTPTSSCCRKAPLYSSNSYMAQGGVAAALGERRHARAARVDTLRAGRGLCRESAVRLLTEEAPRGSPTWRGAVRCSTRPGARGRPFATADRACRRAETGKRIAEALAARSGPTRGSR